ncbi:hypothetical protein TOPH_01697 [Tolypocladium ophioglossoides CBS 100239]|uniref:PhnB-like domain-containing protein n=1 Tax=Tolypocladium ophioglossoides (strain CBS 100239) TaxID=1163406 RepID=A0A0L0NIG6_TOLOC|nr:hypothetical protein TOPH_01697 [Tolypocladium ophioglossoides CBS 100239]
MPLNSLITCLWFDGNAEEAANHYVSIFSNSKITGIKKYPAAGSEIHKRKPGTVMTVTFELNGHRFVGLNGGPAYKLSPAISFQVECEDQAEIDYYWEKLGEGGDEEAKRCGWLADKFGVSWQIVPKALPKILTDDDKEKAGKGMVAMLGMKKIEIDGLQ